MTSTAQRLIKRLELRLNGPIHPNPLGDTHTTIPKALLRELIEFLSRPPEPEAWKDPGR